MTFASKISEKLTIPRHTIIRFMIAALGSQFMYSINSLKTILYTPFKQSLHITNTQVGVLFSVLALVGMFACIPGGWLTLRFPSRKLMAIALAAISLSGFYFATSPSYSILLIIMVIWGISQKGLYWIPLLKTIRCIAPENKQGTAFGILEFFRGSIEFLTNASALALIYFIGKDILGIKIAMIADSTIILVFSFLCWFCLPDDEEFIQDKGNKKAKKSTSKGIITALTMPEAWLSGLTVMGIYTIYVGVQWFVPFLTNVYAMPIAAAAIFALFNTSATRIFASPAGGIIADKKFGSSVNFMRSMLGTISIVLIVIIFLPKSESLLYVAMITMICITIIVYLLRGVYFAPVGEMNTPKDITGAVMSVAAVIGYSPSIWLNAISGYLLDKESASLAYTHIFTIMLCGALVGLTSTVIIIQRKKNKANA